MLIGEAAYKIKHHRVFHILVGAGFLVGGHYTLRGDMWGAWLALVSLGIGIGIEFLPQRQWRTIFVDRSDNKYAYRAKLPSQISNSAKELMTVDQWLIKKFGKQPNGRWDLGSTWAYFTHPQDRSEFCAHWGGAPVDMNSEDN